MSLKTELTVNRHRLWLAIPLLGIFGNAAADRQQYEGLETKLLTFSDWQIGKARFCPEEPVIIFAQVSNTLDKPVDLRLIPGNSNRALVQISNASNAVVWDTDELDRLEEKRHAEQHGIGRIFAGPSIVHMTLEPGASAYWISRWEQQDLTGDYVSQGEYLINVDYRWLHLGDEGNHIPIPVGPASILITQDACD